MELHYYVMKLRWDVVMTGFFSGTLLDATSTEVINSNLRTFGLSAANVLLHK